MKMTKRIGFVLCVLFLAACLLTMSGCKPSLKGMEIVIGNWWENYDTNTKDPRNEAEERILDWRIKIQNEHGFRMIEKNIASWNEMPQVSATSIMTGTPAATVFVLEGRWAMSLISQNLVFPVTDNRVVNLRDPQPVEEGQRPPEWNQATLDIFNFGGKSYALSVGVELNNAQVVFFNKRLFKEAGLDEDLPYDMQRDGTWTWENFLDICKQLTADTDNDGIIDTYAMPRDLSTEILDAIITSNGAQYVGRDENGRFFNATNTPEFIEALQFAIRLSDEGVMKPRPEGSQWDWYKSEFADGNVAMRIEQSYVWNELGAMRDDWGVVLFPKGPRSSTYRVYSRENVMVIPSIYKAADVDRIMYALALWYTPQTDDWKSGWYATFRDRRAVNETLELIRDTSLHIHKNYVLIPGLNRGDIAWNMWYHEGDPAQLIESVSENWNSLIKEVNDGF